VLYVRLPAGPGAGPDLIAAVQEQLGLKLEEKKGPVEFSLLSVVPRMRYFRT